MVQSFRLRTHNIGWEWKAWKLWTVIAFLFGPIASRGKWGAGLRGWPGAHPPVSWCQPRHCQPRGKLQGRGPCVGCLMSVSWDQNFDIQRRGSPVKISTLNKTVLKIYLELPLKTIPGAIKEEDNQSGIKELPRWFSYYWMDKTKNFIYVALYLSNWLNN